MYSIKINDLTKFYKNVAAVKNLNLEIKEGELFALLGVNGAGKTTTIKMLSCLSKPSGGNAYIGNHSIITEPNKVKSIIGVSPQETAIAPNLTVKENLELICRIHNFTKEETEKKIETLSNKFEIGEILKRKAGKLSGGMQRRVSIIMALISEPKILFLDEPTLGLDVIARRNMWDIIKSLKGKITIILTTHYMEEASALSDRIGIMKNSTMLSIGTAEELKTKAGCDDFESAFITLVKEENI